MIESFATFGIPAQDDLAQTLGAKEKRAVLICDVVESVRWMQNHEDQAVNRWSAYTQQVRSMVALAHGGSVVKSTGDGMLIEFSTVSKAVLAAAAMHAAAAVGNQGLDDDCQMQLRIGIHHTEARRDAHDLYGHGVNLTARITALAGPGETVVSAEARDFITHTLDGDIEDMGECYLKHVKEPTRVYRVGAASASPILTAQREYDAPLYATIAVIPFASRSATPENLALGDLIADGVIAQLGRSADLKVISRLSTTAFRDRDLQAHLLQKTLGASYSVSGSYAVFGAKILVTVEITDTQTDRIVWAERIENQVNDLMQINSEICNTVACMAHREVLNTEAKAAINKPLPTLHSNTLLLSGIQLTHRLSAQSFMRAEATFNELIMRHPRVAAPRAWLAKWHVLRVVQGWAIDPATDSRIARATLARAFDLEPDNALALAIDGLVSVSIDRDLDTAQLRYNQALAANPNESLAWLFQGMLHAFKGEGAAAVESVEKARGLSPLDPTSYFYDSLAASAYLSAEDYVQAIAIAKRSLRSNAMHASTYRVLAIAQALSGDSEAAHSSATKLLAIDKGFSVSRFIARSPGTNHELLDRFAHALREAGIPS
jgi:adenylate cyclase